jgi:trk system potassium uptake protein TrkA
MKIVIGGAGDVGFHLASLLVKENQDITLIDEDESVLQYASNHLDVKTIRGSVSSIEILKLAQVNASDLFIAVTTLEETNLLASILAKNLGAKQTIARISNPEFFHKTNLTKFKEFGVDSLLSPRSLAVDEINRLIQRVSATDVYEFEDGKISIIGFTADNSSSLIGKSFKSLHEEASINRIKIIVVLRNGKTIIPNKDMIVKPGDHIYLSTDTKDFQIVNSYVGKTLKKIKRVMIIGDTDLALDTAVALENKFSTILVVPDELKCKEFNRILDNTLIIHGDPNNIDLLKEEWLDQMDAFIALTPNSETNIISSLLAENAGVYKTISLVDNSSYTHISQNIGVDTIINKKILAANHIFRFVRKGKIEAIASFHGVNAEIIEFIIHKNNRVTKNTLGELKLPKNAIVAGVIRGEKGIIPNKDFVLQMNDKVIVFVSPEAIKNVEDIFK